MRLPGKFETGGHYKARFTETQIMSILGEAESGLPVTEVCRKYGISGNTFYNWKKKYDSIGPILLWDYPGQLSIGIDQTGWKRDIRCGKPILLHLRVEFRRKRSELC